MKISVAVVTLLVAVSSHVQANDSPEALQEAFMAALRGNDAAALAACYSKDAVNFPVDSLVGMGPDSVRQSWAGFFSVYEVVEAGLSQKHLEIHGETAIAWGLFTIMARPIAGGEATQMNGRYMDVARSFNGQWLYVADHASMPIPDAEAVPLADDAADGPS